MSEENVLVGSNLRLNHVACPHCSEEDLKTSFRRYPATFLRDMAGRETYQERNFHEIFFFRRKIYLFDCWCSLGLFWGWSRLEGHTVCVAGNHPRPREIRPALSDLLSLVFCIISLVFCITSRLVPAWGDIVWFLGLQARQTPA